MNKKLNVGNMDDVKWGPITAAEEMQNDQQFSKDEFLNRPADIYIRPVVPFFNCLTTYLWKEVILVIAETVFMWICLMRKFLYILIKVYWTDIFNRVNIKHNKKMCRFRQKGTFWVSNVKARKTRLKVVKHFT